MKMMTDMLTISVLTFTSLASSTSDESEASAGIGKCRSSLGLVVRESFPLLSEAPVGALAEVALLVSSLGCLLALHPQLGSFLVLLHHGLKTDSLRVFRVLLIPSEDPHHAVLEAPLLSSFHMPLAEIVDICSMVDIIVHEVLFGFDFVSVLEVDLLRVPARIETGSGVLAVEH